MTRQFQAVTGRSTYCFPISLNQKTYGWPLTLPWIKVVPMQYRHPEFVLYHDFEVAEHRQITELAWQNSDGP